MFNTLKQFFEWRKYCKKNTKIPFSVFIKSNLFKITEVKDNESKGEIQKMNFINFTKFNYQIGMELTTFDTEQRPTGPMHFECVWVYCGKNYWKQIRKYKKIGHEKEKAKCSI